ncbi:hypothetical protein [Streptomyces cellulosae]|uniref:Uncharacterized protein n=1 Tax=Streptomyces cellulosae TaxID=1968 RepID=A0ABW7Y6H8_STRCE
MGERENGDGTPGRRRAHPAPGFAPGAEADAWSGSVAGVSGAAGAGVGDSPGLEALLRAALRRDPIDDEGERRAVAAFLAAREAGTRRARSRRRDDWRPREQRRRARTVRTTLSVALASLTLGGVAFAAIGNGGPGPDGTQDRPSSRPNPSASGAQGSPSGGPSTSGAPSAPAPADRPATAKDTEAHCRAYGQAQGRGQALDSTAWQRLVTAAGGEANVRAYCAGQLGGATPGTKPSKAGGAGNEGNAGNPGGTDKGGDAGKATAGQTGSDGSGQDAGGTGGAGKANDPDSPNDQNSAKGKKN